MMRDFRTVRKLVRDAAQHWGHLVVVAGVKLVSAFVDLNSWLKAHGLIFTV